MTQKTVYTITRVGKGDAYYMDRRELVGRTGRVESMRQHDDGWYHGVFYLDNPKGIVCNRPLCFRMIPHGRLYFYQVKFEEVSDG
jgi:hypothetical protein